MALKSQWFDCSNVLMMFPGKVCLKKQIRGKLILRSHVFTLSKNIIHSSREKSQANVLQITKKSVLKNLIEKIRVFTQKLEPTSSTIVLHP